MCVRTLGNDRAGEIRITRFLRNRRVTPAEMFETAAQRTAGLVKGRHILAIQDTTSLRDDGQTNSLLLHPTIAVDATNGALLGLVHAEFLQRAGGQKASRKEKAFADKESHRWMRSAEVAASLRGEGAAQVTVIADREGDIYEEFACKPPGVHLLIRAAQDRSLADGAKLFTATAKLPALGCFQVRLPAAPGRAARMARLEVWACPVRLSRPKSRRGEAARALPPEVDLTLVEAREIAPPQGITPAHWRLLTTHRVDNLPDALRIVDFYRERWTIEQLFRTYKTRGFDIENVEVADTAAYSNLAAATIIAAVQVLQLVRDRDGKAGRPLEDVFDPEHRPVLEALSAQLEGKTERQKNPHAPGSLAFANWVLARLGGWTGYYGDPGPVVVLRGMLRFQAISHGFQLGQKANV